MKFTETKISGAYLIEIEPNTDERGLFARTFCTQEFSQYGLATELNQCNISYNPKWGTLRGLHYQQLPYGEVKLVRCTRGAIYDVILDLRPDSPSFKQWVGMELTADNHRMLYIPIGCAHGLQTLVNDTEIFYQMSGEYQATAAQGVRWNDPAFGIEIPLPVTIINDRDRDYPDFNFS
jgi:dTDP-4-dehydrorhamnose 3,5-epimerase